MVACSSLYAVAVLAGIVMGFPTSVCLSADDPSAVSSACVLVLAMRHYFSSSCATWSVVTNLVSLLTSRLRWSDADVERLTTSFHAVSWSVPAALVVAVLLRRDVELDGVLGVCRVTRATVSHSALVVAPLLVCIVVSVTLIVVRLVCRRRDDVQQSSERVGSTLVAVVTLACIALTVIYECAAHELTDGDASTAAAAAVTVIYPPAVSVVTAASIVWSDRAASCSRLVRERCQCSDDEPASAATGVTSDRQSRDHTRVTLAHQHHSRQQQQLMRQNITCRDFNTACHR